MKTVKILVVGSIKVKFAEIVKASYKEDTKKLKITTRDGHKITFGGIKRADATEILNTCRTEMGIEQKINEWIHCGGCLTWI